MVGIKKANLVTSRFLLAWAVNWFSGRLPDGITDCKRGALPCHAVRKDNIHNDLTTVSFLQAYLSGSKFRNQKDDTRLVLICNRYTEHQHDLPFFATGPECRRIRRRHLTDQKKGTPIAWGSIIQLDRRQHAAENSIT